MWSPGKTLEDVEIETILAAMKYHEQNKTRAAESLKISIRTIDAKLMKHEEKNGRRKKEVPKNNGNRTSAGVHMESNVRTPEKQSLPVQQRSEVQKVLSPKTS